MLNSHDVVENSKMNVFQKLLSSLTEESLSYGFRTWLGSNDVRILGELHLETL